MARSIDEIYQAIILSKNSKSSISSLNNSSAFGIANCIFYVCAVGIAIHEQIFDAYVNEINIKKAAISGQTGIWWNDKLLNIFQYDISDSDRGVLAIDDNFIYGYPVVDATKRIVKFCATSAIDRQVTIKIAKDDGSGQPQQLSSDELQAARSFVNTIQDAGTLINTISFAADVLLLDINIYFNAQFGQSTVLDNVKKAIKTYLQKLKFDGTIELLKLIDAIQAVQGVTDVLINNASAKSESSAYQTFNRVYNASAGYASLNETDSIFNMIVQNN
jgi:hypothetical protein